MTVVCCVVMRCVCVCVFNCSLIWIHRSTYMVYDYYIFEKSNSKILVFLLFRLEWWERKSPSTRHTNAHVTNTATPKSIQSLAYLLRNEILDNLDNLRAELQYQLQQESKNDDDKDDDEEVRQLITAAYTAMQKYLEIIPPNEYQSAMEILKKK